MLRTTRFCLLLVLLLCVPNARGQHHDHGVDHAHHSTYVGHQHREIKALSPEEAMGLLEGQGLGFALAAELNGYPGPRHVLDLSAGLNLTDDQVHRTQDIFDAMQDEAMRLGSDIVALEQHLDSLFATQAINAVALDRIVGEIGARRAALRRVHLQAHLDLYSVLTEAQRRHYAVLRGYEPH